MLSKFFLTEFHEFSFGQTFAAKRHLAIYQEHGGGNSKNLQ